MARVFVVFAFLLILMGCSPSSPPPSRAAVVEKPTQTPEPIRSLRVERNISRGGTSKIGVTVHRVEIAAGETRVIVSVENTSAERKAYVVETNANLIQGTRQLQGKPTSRRGLDPIPFGMLPGVNASTELMFGAVDPQGQALRLVWDKIRFERSEDYEPLVWEIPLS